MGESNDRQCHGAETDDFNVTATASVANSSPNAHTATMIATAAADTATAAATAPISSIALSSGRAGPFPG
jgi:hypothetical protein